MGLRRSPGTAVSMGSLLVMVGCGGRSQLLDPSAEGILWDGAPAAQADASASNAARDGTGGDVGDAEGGPSADATLQLDGASGPVTGMATSFLVNPAHTVYVPSSTGQVFGVDEATGSQAWSASAGVGGATLTAGEGVLVAVLYGGYQVVGYGHVDIPDASVVLGDGGPPTPVVLGSGGGAGSLALDPTYVYWTDGVNGDVWRVPKDGGAAAVVGGAAGTEPWSVAVDPNEAYWTAPNFATGGGGSAVMSVSLDGGTATTLAAVPDPTALVVRGARLYWTTDQPPSIQSVAIDGGVVSTVATPASTPEALAVDAQNLYWCGSDGIYRQPVDGGAAVRIGPPADAIAVDATDVYYVTSGSVARVPILGGGPTVLATGRIEVLVAIAIDSQNVYWVEGEGTIQQGAVAAVPKSGGRVAVLASGLSDPSAIAVDDSGIYFTNPAAGGLVEKIGK